MSHNYLKTKTRREFLKDGLRTVLFGGFIFTSVVLGSKKYRDKDSASTCPVNLPCNNCSKLKNCEKPKAMHLKQEQNALKHELPSMQKGTTNAK